METRIFFSFCWVTFYPLCQKKKKFPNTFTRQRRPLSLSLSTRLTANTHPLNGTRHGSACPLTKDNCDLDKHLGWGWWRDIKAKVKSSFSSSVLRFTYNTTGTKEWHRLREGDVTNCRRRRRRRRRGEEEEEEEDADSLPASQENKRKRTLHKSAADSSVLHERQPPPPPSSSPLLTNTHLQETEEVRGNLR